MSYIATPDFPVISWPHTVTSSISIAVLTAGGTPITTVIVAAGDYLGYAANGSDVDTGGTLMAALQTALGGAAGYTPAGVTYTYTAQGIRARLNFSVAATGIRVDFPSTAAARTFGFNATSQIIAANNLITSYLVPLNHSGYWAPRQLTVGDRRRTRGRTFATESMDGASRSVVTWGSNVVDRAMLFPVVYGSFVWPYQRSAPAYATTTGHDTSDTGNLLSNLLDAARANKALTVWTSAGLSRTAWFLDTGAVNDPGGIVTPVNDIAIVEVTLPLRDRGGTAI